MSDRDGTRQADNTELHVRRARLLDECVELETELDRYRDLYEFAPDMYGLLDAATVTILECNNEMVRSLGYERDEIIGKHLLDFHPPAIHGDLLAMVEYFFEAGELPDTEMEFMRKDGTRSPASSKVTAIRDEQGRIVRARSVMRDTTEQKRAEAALAESEERFRSLAETTSMIPWEGRFDFVPEWTEELDATEAAALSEDLHHQMVLTYVGPQCTQVTGFTPEQCLQPGFWAVMVHPEDRAGVQRRLAELLARGDSESIEYRIIDADGLTVWLLNQCRVVRRPTGPSFIAGVAVDISDRKAASDRRRRVMRELDHRVKDTLAVVATVAERTGASAGSYHGFSTLLSSRVRALARVHAALSAPHWLELTMGSLLDAALGTDRRLRVAGPPLSLPLRIAQPLGMALRELAINAATHGALSVPSGTVSLDCVLADRDRSRVLSLRWIETEGPPVSTPRRRGYGMYLVEDALAYEVDAEVAVSFPPSGMACTISIPLGAVNPRSVPNRLKVPPA
ncbi:MAG: PAS domain S-box protein [Myxococcales bacterium]|nr:MAG: PAS domain S-box protein [Myxococcales bacterium]